MLGFRPSLLPSGELPNFGKLIDRLNLFGVVCTFFDGEDECSYPRYGVPVVVTYLPEKEDYLIGFIDAELYIEDPNGKLELQKDIEIDKYRLFFREFSKISRDLLISGVDQLTTEWQLQERWKKEDTRYEEQRQKKEKEREREMKLREELGLEENND